MGITNLWYNVLTFPIFPISSSNRFNGPDEFPTSPDPDKGREPLTDDVLERYRGSLVVMGLRPVEVDCRIRELRRLWHSSLIQEQEIPIAGVDYQRIREMVDPEDEGKLDPAYWIDKMLAEAPAGITAWPMTADEFDAWVLWREAVISRSIFANLETINSGAVDEVLGETYAHLYYADRIRKADDERMRSPGANYSDLRK